MIRFQDFFPKANGSGGFLGLSTTYETIDRTVETANAWIAEHGIRVLNVETVMMPNPSGGTLVARMKDSGEMRGSWYQVIRVWYDVPS